MADKRISQLVDRGTVANNDVVPIVVNGAVTTNKATISSIQTFMQGNLDLGVTSVGITFGTSGTDINASGSPVTSSGNITINLPTASATNRGALSSADWITFNAKQPAGNYVTLDTVQTITAQKTFTTSGSSDTMIISHGSGSGFALDVIKAGNNEAIRVTKTSGSGNAMTVIGGNFEAPTIVKTGGTSAQYLMADGSVSTLTNPVTGTGVNERVALWNGTNSINSDSDFTYNSSTNLLTIGGGITLTGAQTIQTSTGNLTLATAAGNGNIVLNAHGDGNVTTNDSIFIGSTSGINYGGLSNKLSVATTNYNLFDISRFSNDNDGARLYLGKSRGSTVGSSVIVQNGDLLGTISFEGDCGEGMVPAASISAEVDGVPGLSSDMPGRLIFRTCADNTIFATERMRISSTGLVTLTGALSGTSANFIVNQNSTSTNSFQNTNTTDTNSRNILDVTAGNSTLRILSINNDHVYISPTTSRNTYLGFGNALTLASTGAATFSSSVTAGGKFISTMGNNTEIFFSGTATTGYQYMSFKNTSGQMLLGVEGTAAGSLQTGNSAYSTVLTTVGSTDLSLGTNQVERMRITSGGKLLIGTPNAGYGLFTDQRVTINPTNDGITVAPLTQDKSAYTLQADNNTGSRYALYIANGSSNEVGSISFTSSLVLFNTTSDYRLKEDLQEFNGLEKVLSIKVYDYKWKDSEDRMDGVLAHELAEVLPYAVNREKDQVNDEGNILPQGVDYSKIVPVLIKAIQELKIQIDSLKNQIK
jgi:hypothetical protein